MQTNLTQAEIQTLRSYLRKELNELNADVKFHRHMSAVHWIQADKNNPKTAPYFEWHSSNRVIAKELSARKAKLENLQRKLRQML
jgi:signal recognition particle subunit SEC65